MSGAAAWLLAAPAVTTVAGAQPGAAVMLTGTAVCAGSALLPDIDSPSSTVARSFGLPTVLLAHLVDAVGLAVYNLTRSRRDEPRHGGHRTITHIALSTLTLGAGVAALCAAAGRWAVIGVLFVTLGLAIRGLMADWAKQQGWVVTTAAAAAGALFAWWMLPQGDYGWLGFAVALGATMHLLGDMITKNGCPILAPLPWRGKRWWEFTLPSLLRIRAGGWFEYTLLLPVLTGVVVIGGMQTFTPHLWADLMGATG